MKAKSTTVGVMAADRLQAVGDPGLRAALLFVRGQPGAITADDLAAHEGVHRNVARGRLERLADAGLVESVFERRSGRSGPGAGRPAKLYRAAPELSGIEFPARGYETLVGLLADSHPGAEGRRRLRDVGIDFGRHLARSGGLRPSKRFDRGLERVCAAIRSLGYQATLERAAAGEAVISTSTCPLRPLVTTHPGAVAIDEGMWAGLVEAGVAGVEAADVACETGGCADATACCRVRVRLLTRE